MGAVDPLIGVVVGNDEVIELLSRDGAMGVVYRARHRWLSRDDAIKFLNPELLADAVRGEEAARRFFQEARIIAGLESPHIVRVHDCGRTPDGWLYITMELVRGRTLRRVLGAERRLTPGRACSVAHQICAALGDAHQNGIVHRDVKPENVMLVDGGPFPGFVKVLDFGVAKLAGARRTVPGLVFGTPDYMAPEQVAAEGVDARSDVYGLGVCLYEMLCGVNPYTSPGSVSATLERHQTFVPMPADDRVEGLPTGLGALVSEMLAKDPDDRPVNVYEVQRRLEEILPEAIPGIGRRGVEVERRLAVARAAIADERRLLESHREEVEADRLQLQRMEQAMQHAADAVIAAQQSAEQAERRASAERDELVQERAALARTRAELAAARREAERLRAEAERLRTDAEAREAVAVSLADEAGRSIETERAAADLERREIFAARKEIARDRRTVKQAQAQVETDQARIAEERLALDTRAVQLESDRRALDTASAQLEATWAEVKRLQESLKSQSGG